jgi:hypothetical protein
MAYCPEKAIEAGHSWAVILYYISSTSVSVYLLHLLVPYTGEILLHPWIALPLEYAYLLASMAGAYGLFSLLLRVSFINALFTHTTFTHVFRRYHEADTKTRDLLGG